MQSLTIGPSVRVIVGVAVTGGRWARSSHSLRPSTVRSVDRVRTLTTRAVDRRSTSVRLSLARVYGLLCCSTYTIGRHESKSHQIQGLNMYLKLTKVR